MRGEGWGREFCMKEDSFPNQFFSLVAVIVPGAT